MSRVIVKNLPNKILDKRLYDVFGAYGTVTDVQLKYTPEGKFRNFAFVGFQTEEQAQAAKNALDKTFINTSKISVEPCVALADSSKPRSWSKHASDSSNKVIAELPVVPQPLPDAKKKKQKVTKEDKVAELLKEHKGDALFEEFMEAHLPEKRKLWKKLETEEDELEASAESNVKEAEKSISDLEYLKLKKSKDAVEEEPVKNEQILLDRLSVKLSNLPCTIKKPDIKEFIKPAKPVSIRIPMKMKGIAYCDFADASEMKKALFRNRSFMGSRRVLVKAVNKEKKVEEKKTATKRKREEERLGQGETVAESGRLFLRNLAYTVMEDDLRPIFEKYGPITELNLPIDPISRKSKGFGFVTYLIPEHACRALNELDGSVMHGRMLHILPGLAKNEGQGDEDDSGLSWKQKKMKKQKQQAGSKVNWNTFFINENCLAEAIADKYNATKETVLTDSAAGGGAAVRLALGETEMVQNTKDFLVKNGVLLEAFDNMGDAQRSENVILVKNLPFKTEESEIREKFASFGELKSVLLSPYGGTCIVAFIEPSEARKAFKRLAYSRFRHIPLYLEWAPKTIFDGRKTKVEEKSEESQKVAEELEAKESDAKEDEGPHEPQEGATLYVKGINFSTNSDGLRKHFEQCGKVVSSIVAEKRDAKNPGQKLSMGYGFVEFASRESADKALKDLQFSTLDNHKIELKRSNRTTNEAVSAREKSTKKGKPSSKMVVRNVPFQATEKELRDLFKVFGDLKALRLPKKMVGTGSHRGFCFIEYHTIHDAKRAFKALSESTHLYGRRLVLEWAETDDDIDALRVKTAKQFSSAGPGSKKKNFSIDDTPMDED